MHKPVIPFITCILVQEVGFSLVCPWLSIKECGCSKRLKTMSSPEIIGEPCIRFGVFEWMPFILISKDGSKATGMMLPLLDLLSKKLQRCYELVIIPNQNVGVRLENGTWNGLLGKLTRKEIDMSGLALSFTPQRYEDVDFDKYLFMDEVTASFARPTTGANITGFSNPFVFPVWLLLLATFVFVSVICCFVGTAYHRIAHKPRDESASGNQRRQESLVKDNNVFGNSLTKSTSWTFGILLSQSLPSILVGDSVRAVGGIWMLACLVISTVYRSNLKAMLILPSMQLPFDNIQELAKTDFPICTTTGSMFYLGIVSSPDNTSLGRLKHQLVESGRRHEGVACSQISGYWTGGYVAIGPMTAMSQLLHMSFSATGRCQTYVMSENFFKTTAIGFMFPKGSPLKKEVDRIVMNLREFGILKYQYDKSVFNATQCLKPPTLTIAGSNSSRAMVMADFYGIFLIYLGGVIASAVIFLIEIVLGRKGKLPDVLPVSSGPLQFQEADIE